MAYQSGIATRFNSEAVTEVPLYFSLLLLCRLIIQTRWWFRLRVIIDPATVAILSQCVGVGLLEHSKAPDGGCRLGRV